jgi:hypothetical protein
VVAIFQSIKVIQQVLKIMDSGYNNIYVVFFFYAFFL